MIQFLSLEKPSVQTLLIGSKVSNYLVELSFEDTIRDLWADPSSGRVFTTDISTEAASPYAWYQNGSLLGNIPTAIGKLLVF